MLTRKAKKSGFTLIEVVVSLILIGLLTVLAGLGLSQIARGYTHARLNAETAEKGQLAMARIAKELGSIHSIYSGSANSIHYVRVDGVEHNLIMAQDQLNIVSGTQADPLINHVSIFSLSYQDGPDGQAVARYSEGVSNMININLGIAGAEGYVSTFNNRIYLRPYNR